MRNRILLALLILLTVPCLGQSALSEAKSTAKLLDSLYKKAGPQVGCLLYEPEILLTIAGFRPTRGGYSDKLSAADQAKVEGLNGLAEGLRFEFKDTSITVHSLKGLERMTSQSKLPSITPFKSEEGWSGFDAWFPKYRKTLENAGVDKVSAHVYGIRAGLPDSAIRATIAMRSDPLDYDRYVELDIPGQDRLETDLTIRVMPEDVEAPDVVATQQSWGGFLGSFYSLPEVKERLIDAGFQAARKAAGRDSYSEKWDRDERLLDSGHFQPSSYRATVSQERVLNGAIEELEASIMAGDPPREWYRLLLKESSDQGVGFLEPEKIAKWAWAGGYDRSPVRNRLYKALKKGKPTYLQAIAIQKLGYWQARDVEEIRSYEMEGALRLMLHPEVKQRFSNMSATEQAKMLEKLDDYSGDVRIRALMAEPPYKP